MFSIDLQVVMAFIGFGS